MLFYVSFSQAKGLGKKYFHHPACPLVRLLRCTRQHISTNMHRRVRLVHEPNYGAIWRIYLFPKP